MDYTPFRIGCVMTWLLLVMVGSVAAVCLLVPGMGGWRPVAGMAGAALVIEVAVLASLGVFDFTKPARDRLADALRNAASRIWRRARLLPKRMRNRSAGCGAIVLLGTALFPFATFSVLFAFQTGDGDEAAFLASCALIHLVCAAVLYVRATGPSTSYSLRTLLLGTLVVGAYIGGFVYLGVNHGRPDGAGAGWAGGMPAVLASAALLWSVTRDARDARKRSGSDGNMVADE